jgi:hypothetical protein
VALDFLQPLKPENQNGPLRQKQAALGVNPKVLFGEARDRHSAIASRDKQSV